MEKIWKKVLIFLGLSLLACMVLKFFKIISAYNDMKRTLPKHLENNFGEKPDIEHSLMLFFAKVAKIDIKIKASANTIEKSSEIERVTKSYLINFYPILTKGKIDIKLGEK